MLVRKKGFLGFIVRLWFQQIHTRVYRGPDAQRFSKRARMGSAAHGMCAAYRATGLHVRTDFSSASQISSALRPSRAVTISGRFPLAAHSTA